MHKSISIYIPTHNRPKMLERALNSLLNQTYKNFQVLVCNDGSSKSYDDVIAKFKHRFEDFKYLKNMNPLGACNARNKLIDIADGEYITGLDDDDEFLNTRLNDFIQSPHLDNFSFLCAGHVTKTSRGSFVQKISSGEILLDDLLSQNLVGNQVFTKTKFLKECGAFDENFPSWQDYDTWVRLTRLFGNGYRIEKYNYRWNIDHEEGRISNSAKAVLGYELFIDKHSDILSKKNLRNLYIQDKINRGDTISWKWVMKNFYPEVITKTTKYTLKKQFPGLKEWIYRK